METLKKSLSFLFVIDVYKAGAIWRVYLMNSPNTVFPSDIITKVRGYYANTATDIVEVSISLKQATTQLQTALLVNACIV